MANLQFEDFCQKVCQMLRWKAAWGPVSAELTAHLEDHAAALEARGLSPEEAAAQAVTAMGNPYALGHALDQTHPPTLPRVSRLFLAVGLLALFLGILLGLNRDSGLFALAGVVPQPPELSYDTGGLPGTEGRRCRWRCAGGVYLCLRWPGRTGSCPLGAQQRCERGVPASGSSHCHGPPPLAARAPGV
ncbi:hypothetical protein HMPREF0995_02638 [Lachnospiraceae bacterium 7_1_58FAA]|nr:hypothetical protein HMPREF0995_02638 [Lachnospiraceae bacterium 7_1_58FAA]